MSFYIKFYLQVKLKTDYGLPNEVEEILKYLADQNGMEEPKQKPIHEFFKTDRWDQIKCLNYPADYLEFEAIPCDGINHEQGEIKWLIDWLKPYCDQSFNRGWIGWQQSEGMDHKEALFWE